jgi:hypothetical protein
MSYISSHLRTYSLSCFGSSLWTLIGDRPLGNVTPEPEVDIYHDFVSAFCLVGRPVRLPSPPTLFL